MELVMMLPNNKPPFIGLVFKDENIAVRDSQYLLEIEKNKIVTLKVSLVEREYKLFVLVDFNQHIYLKISIDETFAAANYRKFETADIVNFGPVLKRNGKLYPIRSLKYNKWIFAPVSKVGFYFRNHL